MKGSCQSPRRQEHIFVHTNHWTLISSFRYGDKCLEHRFHLDCSPCFESVMSPHTRMSSDRSWGATEKQTRPSGSVSRRRAKASCCQESATTSNWPHAGGTKSHCLQSSLNVTGQETPAPPPPNHYRELSQTPSRLPSNSTTYKRCCFISSGHEIALISEPN